MGKGIIRLTGMALLVSGLAVGCVSGKRGNQSFMVKDGKPMAEIVIAEAPTRMQKLAAEELREHVKKISGSELSVTSVPSDDIPNKIYVGDSESAEKLGLTSEGLVYGAFMMKSGDGWLALIGNDANYVPPKWMATSPNDRGRIQKMWNEATGGHWGVTIGRKGDRAFHQETGWWRYDQRGSFNAVNAFLRRLGCRWFMPGDIGEVVPTTKTIAIPEIDEVKRPDFAIRHMSFTNRYDAQDKANILWYYRLGLNDKANVLGLGPLGHGINSVHDMKKTKAAHPEWFALWSGKRATNYIGSGAPCLSSPELFEQNVNYVNAMFDIYDIPMISVMPCDNYEKHCECPLCEGRNTPNRGGGRWGNLSDYVWSYVDGVAKEVEKTHPDKRILCFAYDNHTMPPLEIDKLNDNVVVGIARGWRYRQGRPELIPTGYPDMKKLLKDWTGKCEFDALFFWDYYLYSDPRKDMWFGVPVYFPRAIAECLRMYHSIPAKLYGDYVGVTTNMPGKWPLAEGRKWGPLYSLHAPGFNHLNIYATSRLYWNVNDDVDALMNDYYHKFFGPAAEGMKAFTEYSEANWHRMSRKNPDVVVIRKALDLLDAARIAAGDGIYGDRIDLVIDYTNPMRNVLKVKKSSRRNAPKATGKTRSKDQITLDGKLDDDFWNGLPTYSLEKLKDGGAPKTGTTFKVGWADDALYFGVRCEEPATPKVTTDKNDDLKACSGDTVEFLLETPDHSYYQLVVGPNAVLVDMYRRSGSEFNKAWNSGAAVATSQGKGFWTVEIRIPIHNSAGAGQTINPLQSVIGSKPSKKCPWYFNVCRQRKADGAGENTAFSPTRKKSFHVTERFAELVIED